MEKVEEMIKLLDLVEKDSVFPINVRTAALEANVGLMKLLVVMYEVPNGSNPTNGNG